MAEWSPNRHPRPRGAAPWMLVIHSTEGRFEGAVKWLSSARSQASAHYVIARDGRTAKLVPLSDAAWHVRGKLHEVSVNDVSIGIELESYPGARDYPDAQMRSLARLVRTLCEHYSIEAIIPHKRLDPDRRSDPVGFPWKRFWAALRA